MFYRYEIKKTKDEDVLYLYLTMNYEFSKELGLKGSDVEIKRRTKNFIKNNNINFNSGKVYLIVDGIMVRSFDIKNIDEIEILKDNLYYSNDHYYINLRLESNTVIEISLKDYLLGVLATNCIPDINIEVLKALAILYRTYAFKKMHEDDIVDALDMLALYKPISYYKLSLAPNYDNMIKLFEEAIDDTNCIFITYKDYYILPFIHITNNGFTLKDDRYPYLSSVYSLWDYSSPYFIETKKIDYNTLSNLFKFKINNRTKFSILEKSPYGKVLKIKIGKHTMDGKDFKNTLNLRSQYINIIINRNNICIISRGYGDFLGLSIYGSNEIALNGCNYSDILNYYFPNTKLKRYIKELP